MPANLFRSRESAERKDVAEARAQLEQFASEQPELAQAATLQSILIQALYRTPQRVGLLRLTAEQVRERLAAGTPLLRGVELPIDPANLRELLLRLCDAVGGRRGPAGATNLARALRAQQLDAWQMARVLLAGQGEQVAAQLKAARVQPDSALTLLRLALLPFLEQLAAQLEPLRRDLPWDHGYCPCCGAWPLLAEQRGLEQLRFLRCGLCASAWSLDRLRCAFCGTRDHQQLGYLEVEGEEQRQRIATCNNCHHYLKLRSTLGPLSTPQLLAAEVLLLHLDLIALDKGYNPPS